MRHLFLLGLLGLLAALLLPLRAEACKMHQLLLNEKNQWLNTARPLTEEDVKGRLVLLDFWTYGCINCMQVVPDLKSLEAEFGDRLLVVGVHSAKFSGERDSKRILAAAQRFGITHPVINDSDFAIWKAYGVRAWPTLVLVDEKGEEITRYAGEGHREEIAQAIRTALKSTAAPAAPLAGLAAKPSAESVLSFPARLGHAADTPWGEIIFIADSGHNRILGVGMDGAVRVTIGTGAEGADDGAFDKATFRHPRGFAVTKEALYIADTDNHMIRRADFAAGTVTRIAGTGVRGTDFAPADAPAAGTALASPWDADMLDDGHTLLIAMAGLHQLWALDTGKGTVSVFAGSGREDIIDGAAKHAALAQPSAIVHDGDIVYFLDAESSALRVLKGGEVRTLVGTGLFKFGHADGQYPDAMLQHPQGLSFAKGMIIIADTYNNALRRFDAGTRTLATVKLAKGALDEPGDVLQLGGKYYVADTNNHRIVTVTPGKTAAVAPFEIKMP
jgi:thiol-disulfide isomerase/thioredoxin